MNINWLSANFLNYVFRKQFGEHSIWKGVRFEGRRDILRLAGLADDRSGGWTHCGRRTRWCRRECPGVRKDCPHRRTRPPPGYWAAIDWGPRADGSELGIFRAVVAVDVTRAGLPPGVGLSLSPGSVRELNNLRYTYCCIIYPIESLKSYFLWKKGL